ncbi:MAG TPA: heme lyase CcmF/NrfE family subunit [Usitatibacter sp.]|nr:heme lyase CcmF/NrfE family subunit [Usitatibacter sp.]
MIPEIGHFALIVALLVALVQAVVPLAGAHRGDAAWMASARITAAVQALLVLVAFGCLTHAFVTNDFSLAYTAAHSNSMLPIEYRVAAVWGGHEGSMLLWVAMLALWTLGVALFSRQLPAPMVARVLAVMGMVSAGFLLFLLLVSNPFERLLPAAADGRDLNPLLQDPGMVLHPPMLYMGYVGFSVAFAFSIAALLGGNLDAAWARWSRPWTAAAWSSMTLGIALGSWWAYYELGWGGWWFWDPVENASFMPWLVGTALLHSLAVTEKRGAFKSWTVLLAIAAFSMSLLGTFLVRSGVLTSVHAFATDPKRGVFILAFLAVVTGGSLALFAWRAPKLGASARFEMVSRESLLLVNNAFLVAAAGAVLLGTLYPLFLDALKLGKISVGPPYFESVFPFLMLPAVVLVGWGPAARWGGDSAAALARDGRWAALASLVAALAVPFALGKFSAWGVAGLWLAFWVFIRTGQQLVARWRLHAAQGWLAALRAPSRGYYAMHLAHLGLAVFIVGVTLVKGYETSKDVRMEPGDTVTVAGYTFRMDGVAEVNGPNYVAARATITVTRGGETFILQPEKRLYRVQQMPMTEAAIRPTLAGDVYVSLGEALSETTWVVRAQVKPFVDWIWGGCILMAAGGLLALSDRRYRVRAKSPATLPLGATAGAAD